MQMNAHDYIDIGGKRIKGETTKVDIGFFDAAALGFISWHPGFVTVMKAREAVASRNGQDMRNLGMMQELTDILGPRLLLTCCSALLNTWLPPYDLIWLPRSFPHICILSGGKAEWEREDRFLSFFFF